MTSRLLRVTLTFLLALHLLSLPTIAGPTVVPTAEGQIGVTPGLIGKKTGDRFEPVLPLNGGGKDLLTAGLIALPTVGGDTVDMDFLSDMIHGYPDPVPISTTPTTFDLGTVDKRPPGSARMRNTANDNDWVVFSYADDGPMPNTMNVNAQAFDADGSPLGTTTVAINSAFPFPDPSLSKTGVAVDEQGRATVVYTELPTGGVPSVRAQRFDAATGTVIDPDFLINGFANDAAVALLDPAGNRLLVGSGSGNINGNIVDLTGPTPTVGPAFPVSTTPGNPLNFNPAIAADPETGKVTVVWEHVGDLPGNPIDIRGRRFDAAGSPVGNDFVVNTTTANSQGQPQVAYGPQNLSAVAWTGDGAQLPQDGLDTFLQVYDPSGNPIGGEIKVNTSTDGIQDRPAVRFLPESDGQGRPQVMVAWRDVGNADGSSPNGTGTGYRCFSIEGFPDPETAIFADGFESGDTSSWSDTQP